jgi:hypothetical protein
MKKPLILAAVLSCVVAAALVAQTITDVHLGKVRINSTASDALCVGSSGGSSPTCTGGIKADDAVFGNTVAIGTSATVASWVSLSSGVIRVSNGSTQGVLQAFDASYRPLLIDGSTLNFYISGAEKGRMHASGGFSWGDTTDPGSTNFRVAGQLRPADGSVSAPAYSFGSDTNTGVYSISGDLLGFAIGGIEGVRIGKTGTGNPYISINPAAWGTGAVSGGYLSLGRNTSGNGAPGVIAYGDQSGTFWYSWADTSGNLRISSGGTYPEEDGTPSETSGTVVGTQTSTRDTKNLLGAFTDYRGALDLITQVPIYRFTYKSGAYGGTIFTGIIADELPVVMMDPDPAHPEGRSFSPVSAFGYTAAAIKALQAEIEELRAEVRDLKARQR